MTPDLLERRKAIEEKMSQALNSVEQKLKVRDEKANKFVQQYEKWQKGTAFVEMQKKLIELIDDENALEKSLEELDAFLDFCSKEAEGYISTLSIQRNEKLTPPHLNDEEVRVLEHISAVSTMEEQDEKALMSAYRIHNLVKLCRTKKVEFEQKGVNRLNTMLQRCNELVEQIMFLRNIYEQIPYDYLIPNMKKDRLNLLDAMIDAVDIIKPVDKKGNPIFNEKGERVIGSIDDIKEETLAIIKNAYEDLKFNKKYEAK